MTRLVARLRLVFAALTLVGLISFVPPAGAQQPSSVNPTASAVKEDKLLQELNRIQGRGSIPDTRSYVVEQPAGRDWRQFHEVTLLWVGAIVMLGMLALTGLNVTFGKHLLLPLMSPNAFSKLSVVAKYVHDYLSFPFVIGLVIIFVLWVRDNVPGRIDVQWLRQAGGFFGGGHPPAPRFN